VAIERLDADHALRSDAQLAALLEAYAQTDGLSCDARICFSAHHIRSRRFGAPFLPLDGAGVAPRLPTS
jgi:hypothetical protein